MVSSTATTPTSWTDSMPIWSTSGDNSTYNVSQGKTRNWKEVSSCLPFTFFNDVICHLGFVDKRKNKFHAICALHGSNSFQQPNWPVADNR